VEHVNNAARDIRDDGRAEVDEIMAARAILRSLIRQQRLRSDSMEHLTNAEQELAIAAVLLGRR
jgi:hypothetical protein